MADEEPPQPLWQALLAGSAGGCCCVAVGHPFDTVKTKQQAQSGFGASSMRETIRMIYTRGGFRGFYHGCWHLFIGAASYYNWQIVDSVPATPRLPLTRASLKMAQKKGSTAD